MDESDNSEENLFYAARQLSDLRIRAAFLDAACPNDAVMRQRLDELFAAQVEAELYFETPAAGPAEVRPACVDATIPEVHGPSNEDASAVIGRYKLLQKIGEGGFGEVYMAEQKEPVKRRVALKIIKLGMDTRQVVTRFEAERQALALMEHPNIAKVFDAGATGSGRPYFVMELVRGAPITQYCDENNLPPVDRLHLFVQVCRAIQHAHQKGIIHRDIKPSNILVTHHDVVPVPKVIDFGIAKATQMELTEKTLFTQFQQFVGTPAYMSPEQAERSGLDIDTRSDVYSLGVLLYELLTGRTPFDAKELLAAGLEEMRRTIREKEPLRPSTRLSTMADAERTGVAQHRRSDASHLIHLVSGDLDWIVMRALEKDRTRRYETASALAMDIERHLHDEPVEARPPSLTYRIRKFVHRHKTGVTAAALITAVLLAGVLVSTWQAIRATKAEQASRRTAYFAEMNSAGHSLTEGNFGRARQLLSHHLPAAQQPDLRGWEWRYLANLTRGDHSQHLKGHTSGVSGLFFLDDNRLLSVGWDRRSIWWDVASGRAAYTLIISNPTTGLAVAPGHHLAALAGNHPSAEVGDVTFLDLDRRAERLTPLHRPNADNTLFDFSVAGDFAMVGAMGTGSVALWEADTGKQLAVFENEKEEYNALRFSPDGRHLAAATREGWIQMWNVAARSNLFSWAAHAREGGLMTTVNTLAFSPNGRHLVSAGIDGRVAVWDSATGTLRSRLDGHHAPVIEAAFSPDGNWLAAASLDHTLYIWETASWTLVKAFRGHSGGVRRVAWSPSGQLLASGGPEDEVLLWNWPPRTNSVSKIEFATVLDFNLSETGEILLRFGGNTNPVVEIWDTKSLSLRTQYPTPDTNIVSGWLLPGGHLIVTGDQAGRIGVRELATGRELSGTNAHNSKVYGITGSADGRVIVTLSRDGEALVWNLPALTLRVRFRTERPFDCRAVTPDGSCLAIGYADGRIELRDLRYGLRRAIWKAHGPNFKALAFSPDGTLLASSSWDRTGKLWDVEHSQLVRSIGGNLLTFESLAFSPDGSRLAAGTGEGTVKLYDVLTAEEVATFNGHHHPVYAVAFSSGGTELISASSDALSVWRAPDFANLKDVEAQLLAHRPNQ